MKYVVVEWRAEDRSFFTSPRRYLEVLPELRASLPAGARAFATDAGHYDYYGRTCTKDLELHSISVPVRDQRDLEIVFSPNTFKHDHPLRISYSGVTRFEMLRDDPEDSEPDAYRVLLDEITPEEGGCLHEIELSGATIKVTAADLTAVWGPF